MSIIDHLQEVKDHTSGIPSNVRIVLRSFGPHTTELRYRPILEGYERLCRIIEEALAGRFDGELIPVDKEEVAAEMVSHLIIDTAYMHERLTAAGAPVGAYPFDYLADKILPREGDPDARPIDHSD